MEIFECATDSTPYSHLFRILNEISRDQLHDYWHEYSVKNLFRRISNDIINDISIVKILDHEFVRPNVTREICRILDKKISLEDKLRQVSAKFHRISDVFGEIL